MEEDTDPACEGNASASKKSVDVGCADSCSGRVGLASTQCCKLLCQELPPCPATKHGLRRARLCCPSPPPPTLSDADSHDLGTEDSQQSVK